MVFAFPNKAPTCVVLPHEYRGIDMEPPLRVRMLQLAQFRDSKDWPGIRHPKNGNGALVLAHRRGDTPLNQSDDGLEDSDGLVLKSPRNRRPLSKALVEKQRRQFLQLMLASPLTNTEMYSPASSRESLFGGFVNDLTWMQTLPSRHLVLQQLRTYFDSGQSEGPMAAATETLLLAQFALTIGDAQHIAAAQRRYGLAMSKCAKKLASKPSQLRDWVESLAAIQALWSCEMYEELSQGEQVWVRHNDGMLAILRQLSIQPEDLTNGFLKMVIYNAVDTATKTAIWARKRPIFAEQHWLDLISSSCEGRGWCLQHIVCQLPTLLYCMDCLDATDSSRQDAVEVLQDLLAIERDLLRWLQEWYISYKFTPIRTSSVHDFPEFVSRHKDIIPIFPKVFNFPSPLEANGHLIYYDWLGIVRQAICDLHNHPQCLDLVSNVDRERALNNATECADAACMLAPYSLQMERTEPAKPILQLLDRAEEWYKKTARMEKLHYVRVLIGDQAKHAEDHELLRWQDVNGFLVRRVLLQHCIGAPKCVLKEDRVTDAS